MGGLLSVGGGLLSVVGRLVFVGGDLVFVGGGLVLVGGGLVLVGGGLIGIRERLVRALRYVWSMFGGGLDGRLAAWAFFLPADGETPADPAWLSAPPMLVSTTPLSAP